MLPGSGVVCDKTAVRCASRAQGSVGRVIAVAAARSGYVHCVRLSALVTTVMIALASSLRRKGQGLQPCTSGYLRTQRGGGLVVDNFRYAGQHAKAQWMILVVRTKSLSCQSKTIALKIDSVIFAGHIPGSIRFFACIALWRVCRVLHRLPWIERAGG